MIEELKKEGLFLLNGSLNPSYSKKFFNTLTEERKLWYNSLEGETFSEKIYLLVNKKIKPKCPYCGKSVKFISYKEGYRLYCSVSCKANHLISKVAETNLKKYGVKAPAQKKEIQDKIKQTCLTKFGVDNIFKDKDKIQKALEVKYGVTNPSALEFVKEKRKKTSISKWGVDHPMKNIEIKEKKNKTNLNKYGNICSAQGIEQQKSIQNNKKKKYFEEVILSNKFKEIVEPLFSLDQYSKNIDENGSTILYTWKCKKCNTVFEDYIANGNIPRCPKCYPSSIQGKEEKELISWLRELLPNETIIQNTRKIIYPLEIDIFIPKYNLAIEMNELYWHSELSTKNVRGLKYHLGKTIECSKKNINLIHIFDFEWINKKEIIKSILKSKLGIYKTKIGARKCIIKRLSVDESKEFLENNHIQGYAPSSIRLGLFYNNELVSHLAISKNRFKKGTYEIVRYVSKINYSVQGGLSKLWKEAKKQLNDSFTLISYVDKRFFTGKSNGSIGLEYKYSNRPAYYYTKDYKSIENRMLYQKKNIEKKLKFYDSKLTEWENMKLNGYDRIWDCGTDVWMLKK